MFDHLLSRRSLLKAGVLGGTLTGMSALLGRHGADAQEPASSHSDHVSDLEVHDV